MTLHVFCVNIPLTQEEKAGLGEKKGLLGLEQFWIPLRSNVHFSLAKDQWARFFTHARL